LLFDPGSFASILTKQVVDDLGLEIQQSDQTISGVGSKNKPCLGKIEADIMIGNATTWPKTTWFVVETDMLGIPGIIGRNPLHCRLNEISYNLGNKTLFFRSRQGWARVPYISNPRTENWDSSDDKHFIYTITESIPTTELVNKLRTELGPVVHLDDNNSDDARQICLLLLKHKQVFSSEDRPIGLVHGFEAEISTLPGRTTMVNQYRLPQKHEEPLTREVEKLVSIGVLTNCEDNRGFNTPIGGVGKPDGTIRLILNFKITLNRILQNEDVFNIPDMQMEALLPPGQKYFMTADIKCGFWNIKVRKEDQHKLAIQWKGNNYCTSSRGSHLVSKVHLRFSVAP